MIHLVNSGFQTLPLSQHKMIFADPPDNIGLNYDRYEDSLPDHRYRELLEDILIYGTRHCEILWISFNATHLPLMGSIVNDFLTHQNIFCGSEIRDWVFKPGVQTYTFYQHNKRDLGNAHRPLWRLMKRDAKLYPDAVRVPSWRQLHGDKRANPAGKVPGDAMHVEQCSRATLPLPNLSLMDARRLLSRIQVTDSDECWAWQGSKRGEYDRLKVNGKLYRATRLVWRLVHGTDPTGQLILHTCDNPSCCNPAHLFLGTDADNSADKVQKNRQARNKGESNGNATLTEEDVVRIYHAQGTNVAISKDYGVSDVTVRNIKTGKTWAHVTSKQGCSDVFDFPRVVGNSKQRRKYHPTQLNEDLYERCLKLSCAPDESACDFFAGTGTLARVCAKTGNPCTMYEIDPFYCKKIAREHKLRQTTSTSWNSEVGSKLW